MGKVSFDTELGKGNDNVNNGGLSSNETTPLLLVEGQPVEGETTTPATPTPPQEPQGFTAGYTDYLHTSNALGVFVFHSLCYYFIAIILFHFVFNQGWTVIDSLYFATVLFTTIGYGDLSPTTDIGRVCTMWLSMYGIVILGIFLGVYGDALVENQKSAASEQKSAMRDAARETVNRAANTRRMASTRHLIPEGLPEDEAENDDNDDHPSSNKPTDPLAAATFSDEKKENHGSLTSVITTSTAAFDSAKEAASEDLGPPAKEPKRGLLGDICRFLIDVLPILSLMVAAGVFIGHLEGWDVTQSIYWVVISGTTIGLGDESPRSQRVRLLCVFFLPCCVAVLGQFLSKIASIYIGRKKRKQQEEFFSRALTMSDLETMDTDSDGEVDKGEFLAYMLVALQMVDKEDIDEIHRLFDALDVDKSGSLQKDDLAGMHMSESIQQAVISSVLEVDVDEAGIHELKVSCHADPGSTRDLMRSHASKWKAKAHKHRRTGSQPLTAMDMANLVPGMLNRVRSNSADSDLTPPVPTISRVRPKLDRRNNNQARSSFTLPTNTISTKLPPRPLPPRSQPPPKDPKDLSNSV